jgi:hypothetical protein
MNINNIGLYELCESSERIPYDVHCSRGICIHPHICMSIFIHMYVQKYTYIYVYIYV